MDASVKTRSRTALTQVRYVLAVFDHDRKTDATASNVAFAICVFHLCRKAQDLEASDVPIQAAN